MSPGSGQARCADCRSGLRHSAEESRDTRCEMGARRPVPPLRATERRVAEGVVAPRYIASKDHGWERAWPSEASSRN